MRIAVKYKNMKFPSYTLMIAQYSNVVRITLYCSYYMRAYDIHGECEEQQNSFTFLAVDGGGGFHSKIEPSHTFFFSSYFLIISLLILTGGVRLRGRRGIFF